MGDITPATLRFNKMQRQLADLKIELFKSEASVDDYRCKSNQQEKEIIALQGRLEEYHVNITYYHYFNMFSFNFFFLFIFLI